MLYLVTFSGMAESEQGNTSSMANSRQEEDELLAQMEEDKRLLDESDGNDKQSTVKPKERATNARRVSSVGTLAKNFMKNVRLGQMTCLRHRHWHPPTALQRPPQTGRPAPAA